MQNKPKQRSNPLSAGDGCPVLMRQAGKERRKMKKTKRNTGTPEYYAKQVPSLRTMTEFFREDNAASCSEYDDRVYRVLLIVAEEPDQTMEDALRFLEDVRKTLLERQVIS